MRNTEKFVQNALNEHTARKIFQTELLQPYKRSSGTKVLQKITQHILHSSLNEMNERKIVTDSTKRCSNKKIRRSK